MDCRGRLRILSLGERWTGADVTELWDLVCSPRMQKSEAERPGVNFVPLAAVMRNAVGLDDRVTTACIEGGRSGSERFDLTVLA